MEQWTTIIYFLLIAALIFIGKFLKTKVPLLNKIVIPTALLGGMLGLILSLVFAPVFSSEVYVEVDLEGRYITLEDNVSLASANEITQEDFEMLFINEEDFDDFSTLYQDAYFNREVKTYYELQDGTVMLLLSKETTFFNVKIGRAHV